jgi:hypothetical protein
VTQALELYTAGRALPQVLKASLFLLAASVTRGNMQGELPNQGTGSCENLTMKRCSQCAAEMEAQDSECPRCGFVHNTRTDLIQKLLKTNHLDVPERRQLVPLAIQFSEVTAAIREVVERDGPFWGLEKLNDGRYRTHDLLDNELAMSVYGPAVDVIEDYPDFNSALQASWKQNTIDGINILGLPTKHNPARTIGRSLFGAGGVGCESAPAAPTPSDHKIIPGDRIGPIRLGGTIDEVVTLIGPSPQKVPWYWPGSLLQTWIIMGISVVYDTGTGNILEISIGNTRFGPWPDYWASYLTPEGVCLGTKRRTVVSRMGNPERTIAGGGAKGLYYDRRGIRFTLLGTWPFTQKVGAIRVVWPSVPHGDTLIVPGKRISSIEVGMPIDEVLTALGGGYHRGKSSPGFHVYYWPHLGLSLVERSGGTISVRAGAEVAADAAGLRYAAADGIGLGTTAAEVTRVYGEPDETGHDRGWHWWTFRSQGISFALDDQSRVRLVDVLPPEKGLVASPRELHK